MGMNRSDYTKTAKILGIFMASAITFMSGCSSSGQHVHVDRNRDGYCDEDGKPMNSSSSGGGHYGSFYNSSSTSVKPSTSATGSSNISTGTAGPWGGIGSHSWGGGG